MESPEADLTLGQREVLEAIRAYIDAHGFSPSQPELMVMVGVNLSTLQGYLTRLRDAGAIDWQPGHPRTIRIL